jgi:hypothetical protein
MDDNDIITDEDFELGLISEYAEAVGLLTIYWATLENSLVHAIQNLLQTDDMTAACIGASADKAATRAQLIQRLVLRPGESPSDQWRDVMLGLCDQVSNSLAKRRNRLIHDDWELDSDVINRRDPTIRIRQPAAGEAKALVKNPAAPSHIPEIRELTELVIDVMLHMSFMTLRYGSWKKTGQLPEIPEQAVRASKGMPRLRHQQDAQA